MALRISMTSEIEEKDVESVVGVVRIRKSYVTVNFQLCNLWKQSCRDLLFFC